MEQRLLPWVEKHYPHLAPPMRGWCSRHPEKAGQIVNGRPNHFDLREAMLETVAVLALVKLNDEQHELAQPEEYETMVKTSETQRWSIWCILDRECWNWNQTQLHNLSSQR